MYCNFFFHIFSIKSHKPTGSILLEGSGRRFSEVPFGLKMMLWSERYIPRRTSVQTSLEKKIYISSTSRSVPFLDFPHPLHKWAHTHMIKHTHTHTHTHIWSHANSCLRIFAQGVSPPKIPYPSLSAHLHPSYPSKLCKSCIWSQRIVKLLPLYCLDFLFFLLKVLRFPVSPSRLFQ